MSKGKISFDSIIQSKRKNDFIKPYELAYKSFLNLGLDKENFHFFFKNASSIVENMREECWKNYLIAEDEFSKSVLKSLFLPEENNAITNKESVYKFIDSHVNDFYTLSLSNTQSRRSRAGTEFEAIIELLFMGAGIIIDSQGFLSSGIFAEHNLGKSVDLISPGVTEYGIQKRTCSLVSCKTSLRERWSEVIEEKERTGASEIYLTTLDSKISPKTLSILNDKNVIPVVTDSLKKLYYSKNRNVITYEELLCIISEKNKYWSKPVYSPELMEERINLIEKQILRHTQLNHEYIKKFYYEKKSNLLNLPDETTA